MPPSKCQLKPNFDSRRKRDKYDEFLQSVPILQTMDSYERSKLSDAVQEERFKKGDFVIRQGANGDKFFMISEGNAIATKIQPDGSQKQVMDYKKGMYFGERALLNNEARAANIIAQTDMVCLSLQRETFMRILGPLDEILKRNMEAYKSFQ